MEKRFSLRTQGTQLWTRPKAIPIREAVERLLEELSVGDTAVVDTDGVEIFDLSYAAELFGKIVLRLAREYPGRFFVVEHLNSDTRENLEAALKQLDLAMIERVDGQPRLIGKFHPVDEETVTTLFTVGAPIAVAELGERLNLRINAANERLAKLTDMGLVSRERARSSAGREQFLYYTLRQ